MATELYGVYAELAPSEASTPVSTDTQLIFMGSCAKGDLNKPYIITSMADANARLGIEAGDGFSLSEAAIAAFQVAGLSRVIMIPVSHSTEFTAADYVGSATEVTGAYALEQYLRENPSAVVLVCAPAVTDGSALEAIRGVCTLADGHWRSFMVYDLECSESQLDGRVIDPASVVSAKIISSENADAVWGRVRMASGYSISGAAVRAALMARSDADYGVPARCGGNLAVPSMVSVTVPTENEITNTAEIITPTGLVTYLIVRFTLTQSGFTAFSGELNCEAEITVGGESYTASGPVLFKDGVGDLKIGASGLGARVLVSHTVYDIVAPIIREADVTSLSADGVCSWIHYGGGRWHTWGDHTSLFSGGTVSEERGRFDNIIRMNLMITNRFQLKYRFEIDNPMTLGMRNSVINEQLDYLNSLVAIGALIGEPVVEFRAADNGPDQVGQGYFTWYTADTPTIPAKHMLDRVAYTQAGLSVYTAE